MLFPRLNFPVTWHRFQVKMKHKSHCYVLSCDYMIQQSVHRLFFCSNACSFAISYPFVQITRTVTKVNYLCHTSSNEQHTDHVTARPDTVCSIYHSPKPILLIFYILVCQSHSLSSTAQLLLFVPSTSTLTLKQPAFVNTMYEVLPCFFQLLSSTALIGSW
jgi:hypothetical protein